MILSINAHLVELVCEGKISSTKHKSSIMLLYEKKQLGLEIAESLLQAYYFDAGTTQSF